MKSNLVKEYCLISLNAERINENTLTMRIKNKCIASAILLQFFLENNQNYVLKRDIIKNIPEKLKFIHYILDGSSEEITLNELLDELKKLDSENYNKIANVQKENFIKSENLEMISALLECDLNYENSGVQLYEYRSNSREYTDMISNIRKAVFNSEKISDEKMILIWLLNESQDLLKIFDDSEIGFLNEIIEQMCKEKKIFDIFFKNTIFNRVDKFENNFLKEKEKWAKTEIGLGVVSRIPILQKSESIFIETQKMFTDNLQRIKAVEERVREKGHLFEIISSGSKTAIVKIDNSYYELIPDAVRVYFTNIHGVRLKRCDRFKN